ncbi:MAG: endolytic transglycosylase MltG [Chloroflexales bacterium]|nr:endolytic transglycosylase MltG [Chloroflexales bacterium]
MVRFFRVVFLMLAILAIVATAVVMLVSAEIRRPGGTDDTPLEFVVSKGETTYSIASRLAEQKLIRQPLLFVALARTQQLDSKLQAGNFLLRQNMTMNELMVALQQSRVKEVQITIIEGMRIEEIAAVVGNSGVLAVDEQTALAAFKSADRFRKNHIYLSSIPEGASLEGYLFPDTYRLNETATINDVIDLLLGHFDEQFATIEHEVQIPGASVHQIVTMASIIQREATRQDEMALVSAVFWNRLKPENAGETGGGKLQSDPTVQYIIGTSANWWPKLDNLTIDQINAAPGPYNTRVEVGLPPGPISTPGLTALRAAARPDATSNYLYFVASCETPGKHNFASSYTEFLIFQQQYLACQP